MKRDTIAALRAMVTRKVAARVPVALQLVGAGAAAAGVFLLAGLAITLLAGGVLLVAYGAAREGGWV